MDTARLDEPLACSPHLVAGPEEVRPMVCAALVGMALLQAPMTPISGTIVEEDGTPVAGTELVLSIPERGESWVAARGKSDEGGRFRFDRPAGLVHASDDLIPTLWTIATGHRVSIHRFNGAMPGADDAVRVVLRPGARTEIRVESPNGEPVAGVRVRVQSILSEATSVPDPVAKLAERATGLDGMAVIDAFDTDDMGDIDVTAPGYGIQRRWFERGTPGPRRIRLLPVGAFSGRLVPEPGVDPKLAKGWRVRVWTHEDTDDDRDVHRAGFGSTTTDDEGWFRIAELTPGTPRIDVRPPGCSELRPELTEYEPIGPGRENVVAIPLRRTCEVIGVVREYGTGVPVAGVGVSLSRRSGSGNDYTLTDTQGRFTLRGLPGKTQVDVRQVPTTHVRAPGYNWDDFTLPPPPARVELKPGVVLRAGPPITGEVRDEAGRTVDGVNVKVEWRAATPMGPASGFTSATTDEAGRFILSGIAPGASATIKARRRDRATVAPVTVVAGDVKVVVVSVVPRDTIAVAVRVLGPTGKPIEGAEVRLNHRGPHRDGIPQYETRAAPEGNARLWTGPDGTYRTPKELDRLEREYQAEILANGFLPEKSAWVAAGPGDLLTLPDITLRPTLAIRSLAGRVVDHEGRPLVGVRVFQSGDGPRRTETKTDDAGRFRLPGVYVGRVLVFAEKAGFRFGGSVVEAENEAPEVRLGREGEPPLVKLATLPSLMSRAEERALGREWLTPIRPGLDPQTIGGFDDRVPAALGRIDPKRVLTMLEDRVLNRQSPALFGVALGQFEDDTREAIATIEADTDPNIRARGFLALADSVPDHEASRRDEWLARALSEARRVMIAEQKIALLAALADRWLNLGDHRRARPILREGLAVISALPRNTNPYEVVVFGEVLAATDLPAARKVFQRHGSSVDDAWLGRHLGEAAVLLAAIDPVEAERVLGMVPGGANLTDRRNLTFRIARRMARADLLRARKLMQTTGDYPGVPQFARPGLVLFGLGLIASERAAIDPDGSRAMLDEAYAGLLKIAGGKNTQADPPVSVLMAALLPAVERLDPDRLAERLWLAASCRPPRAQEPDSDLILMATLGLLISRYDRAVADAITAPAIDRLPVVVARSEPGQGGYDIRIYHVLAAYDPQAIVKLLQTFPPSARKSERTTGGSVYVAVEAIARLAGAEMLGRPIDERRRVGLSKSSYLYEILPERRYLQDEMIR